MGCFLSFFIIIFAVLFFAIISTGLNIISYILRLFGIKTENPRQYDNSQSQHKDENQHRRAKPHNPARKKKIIEDDEGEYVDYEEVK